MEDIVFIETSKQSNMPLTDSRDISLWDDLKIKEDFIPTGMHNIVLF